MNKLESDRLILIPVNVDILDSLIESDECFLYKYELINDGGEYLNPSPEYLHKIKGRLINHPEEYPLAVDHLIVIKEIKTVIGTIYFKALPVDGVSEVGYGMTPKYEGHGYMGEALRLMLEFGKQNGIKKVIADTLIDNLKSQHVLTRNGFSLDRIEDNTMYYFKELF